MRAILLASLLVLAVAAACGGSGGAPVRQALPLMVLQREDVPEGMQTLGSSFSNNEEAASGLGGGPGKAQLDQWGRILGYKEDYQRTEPSKDSAVVHIVTSVSLYKDADGAKASFEDRVQAARSANWADTYSNLLKLSQREITRDLAVDGLFWLRFTGFQETRPGEFTLLADDWVVFRWGRAWGFLEITSTGAPGVDDRELLLGTVEALVRKQIANTKATLEGGIAD